MFDLKIFLFLIFTYSTVVDSYKIFAYNPKSGPSHTNFVGKVADILVQAGHDVTMYQPILNPDLASNGSKLAKIIHRQPDSNFTISTTDPKRQAFFWTSKIDGLFTIFGMYKALESLRQGWGNLCKNQINDDKLMDSLKSEKWDVGIGENFDPCFYGVMHRVGIKNFITISTSTLYENYAMAMGIPSTPSFVPGTKILFCEKNLAIFSAFKPPFSYSERAINIFNYIFSTNFMHRMFGSVAEDFMYQKYGIDLLSEHAKSTYYFVNVDEHVDFPRPVSHKIVYIGGIGKVQAKPLEKKYDDIFKNSKKGVILVSFGSNMQSFLMPDHMKKTFLETFKKFPEITFLWKYEKDEDNITEGYENVVTGKWLPQNDILEHPKLLAFVTHGGMNSVQESSSKGVPMICIPMFADQLRNARMVEYRDIGVTLSKTDISVESFSAAIKEILANDKYRKNAQRLKQMIEDKPMSAEERIVKYTEFAAQFGPDLNLDMHGQNLNFVQFYCLDIIIPFLILVILGLYAVYKILLLMLSKFSSFVYSSKDKKE